MRSWDRPKTSFRWFSRDTTWVQISKTFLIDSPRQGGPVETKIRLWSGQKSKTVRTHTWFQCLKVIKTTSLNTFWTLGIWPRFCSGEENYGIEPPPIFGSFSILWQDRTDFSFKTLYTIPQPLVLWYVTPPYLPTRIFLNFKHFKH